MKGIQTPICSTGIAVVLLKKINGLDKVLLLKRATPVFKDMWCYIGGKPRTRGTSLGSSSKRGKGRNRYYQASPL